MWWHFPVPLPHQAQQHRRGWLEQAEQYTLQHLPPAVGQPVGHIHGSERAWLPFQPTPLRSDLTQLSTAPRSQPARSAEDPGPSSVHRTRRTASWAARSGRTCPPSGRKLVHAPAGRPRSSPASPRWGSGTCGRPSGLRGEPIRSAPWTRLNGKDPSRARQLRAVRQC